MNRRDAFKVAAAGILSAFVSRPSAGAPPYHIMTISGPSDGRWRGRIFRIKRTLIFNDELRLLPQIAPQ